MARRFKDYYSPNNKKTKAGANIFFAFLKAAFWLITIVFVLFINFIYWIYHQYKNRIKTNN